MRVAKLRSSLERFLLWATYGRWFNDSKVPNVAKHLQVVAAERPRAPVGLGSLVFGGPLAPRPAPTSSTHHQQMTQ